jgi:hypothetical protein
MPCVQSDVQVVRVKTERPPPRRSTRRRGTSAGEADAPLAPPPAAAPAMPTSAPAIPLVKPLPLYNSLPLEQYLDAIVDGTMSLDDVLAHAMAIAATPRC